MRRIFLTGSVALIVLVLLGIFVSKLNSKVVEASNTIAKKKLGLTLIVKGTAKIDLQSGNAKWVKTADSGFGIDFTGASHLEIGQAILDVSKNAGVGRVDMDIEINEDASELLIQITDVQGAGSVSINLNGEEKTVTDRAGRMVFPLKSVR